MISRTSTPSSTRPPTTVSSKLTISCKKCQRHFPDRQVLKLHKMMIRLNNRCGSPQRESSSVTGTEKQIRVTRALPSPGLKKNKCTICGKSYLAKCQLNMHMRQAHSEGKGKKRRAEDSDGEEEHGIARVSPNESIGSEDGGSRSQLWLCKCGKKYASKSNLRGHIRFFRRIHSYKCPKCTSRFCWESDWEAHVTSIHGKEME